MATNPAVSMPDSNAVAAALGACPFVVVSDVTANTETARYAHVLLPAAGWGEKDGTVTNSERRISRQRAFLASHGEARPDWKIVCDVAAAMGFSGFAYQTPGEIFREHAELTELKAADTGSSTGLGALAAEDYDALPPTQWGGERPFADAWFQTPRARPTSWRRRKRRRRPRGACSC